MSDDLARAEQAMKRKMRQQLGSAEEQHERLENLIEALFHPAGVTGIDRTACIWWRGFAS